MSRGVVLFVRETSRRVLWLVVVMEYGIGGKESPVERFGEWKGGASRGKVLLSCFLSGSSYGSGHNLHKESNR